MFKECTNDFWKDVISACRSLYDNKWYVHSLDRYTMPLWHNTKLCNYFNKGWFSKGIIYVNDLLSNGDFISLENLRQGKNVKCNFLECETIKQKIQSIHTNPQKERTVGLILPIMLDKINLSGKGCNKIYRIMQMNSVQVINESRDKLEKILNEDISMEDVKFAFRISQKLPKCVFFYILHNRLNTKQLLFKMKISDSEECPYCVNIPDSTLHALINCPISAQLWRVTMFHIREIDEIKLYPSLTNAYRMIITYKLVYFTMITYWFLCVQCVYVYVYDISVTLYQTECFFLF